MSRIFRPAHADGTETFLTQVHFQSAGGLAEAVSRAMTLGDAFLASVITGVAVLVEIGIFVVWGLI